MFFCAKKSTSLLFIIMKLLKSAIFILTLLSGIPPKASQTPVSGVMPYATYPYDVAKPVYLPFKYQTTVTMTLEYYYVVANPQGDIVYTKPMQRIVLEKDNEFSLMYTAYSGKTGVGRNSLNFYHRKAGDTLYKLHVIYFYGFRAGEKVDLNDQADRDAKFGQETVYIYNGYKAGTSRFVKTVMYGSGLLEEVIMAHDLYLNFSSLYFRTNAPYEAMDKMHGWAHIFINKQFLFPYIMKRDDDALLHIKLIKEGYIMSIHPLADYFYDPVTLYLAGAQHPGFVRTNRWILPRNAKEHIEDADFRIELFEFGFHRFHATFRFKVKIMDTFLGEGGLNEVGIKRY